MEEYWIGILGGLIGSSLTVVVTKLLDLFQKSKEHKYSLQKIFFEKKLLAAEVTIAQYTIMYKALSSLAVLYERLDFDPCGDIESYLQDSLGEEAEKQMEIANDASFIVANSITLYFDFETEFNEDEVIKDFYNLLAKIEPAIIKKENTYREYQDSIGTRSERQAHQNLLDSISQYDELIRSISNTYKDFNNHLRGTISHIRNEMKKFEY